MMVDWQWDEQSKSYGNYGNANQWTVNAGLASLARESTQNSNDARIEGSDAELVFTFIRLEGRDRECFEEALRWGTLRPHLEAMGDEATGAVTAGQIGAGLEAIRKSDSLVLLKVSDYGCAGLTGPEFTDVPTDLYGNFIKLCRLDLFSGKDKASGGSFGLGKAVYWRFSRLQTVLFHSVVREADALDGKWGKRLFGVSQGVVHRYNGIGYQGRGYFGVPDGTGAVTSVWNDDELVRRLHLDRADNRPGTSALLLGFYDPDRPELGLSGGDEIRALAAELREGVEENFWPLLARGGLTVRIEVQDGGTVTSEVVDPEETYTELVRALRRFDAGEVDDSLAEPFSVVVRDVPITVSRRRTGDRHDQFVHQAKLVVTLSDEQKDTLENRVCLFRRPEMIVQTIDKVFESHTYHAFLVAGAAINPADSPADDVRADDFLRFAEPPAHDRWVPGSGRGQASQANLTAHYVAPWLPHLRGIEKGVLDVLFGLFEAPPPAAAKPPQAVLKHLRFLRGEQGSWAAGSAAPRKPEADITAWRVEDGRWHVTFEVRAKNRESGWVMRPGLALVGFDGGRDLVEWDWLECVSGHGTVEDGVLLLPAVARGRFVKTVLRGTSTSDLPIPAEESAIEVLLRQTGQLVRQAEEGLP